MKRLLYILPILILACEHTDYQDKNDFSVDITESITKLTSQTLNSIELDDQDTDFDSTGSLKTFRDFAVNYSPTRKPNSGVAMLPQTPDTVIQAMRTLKFTQPSEFEKYLTLIFVKLYSAHLECCNQSYEVRRQVHNGLDKEKDPLVFEFNNLMKNHPDNKPIEFMSSRIGYNYVMANSHLLNFEPIKEHIEIIEQAHTKIKDGISWE